MKMIEDRLQNSVSQCPLTIASSSTHQYISRIKSNPSGRQSFTKARDRQIVVSAWQRPGGIPALAVIPLKCDFKCNSAFNYLQPILFDDFLAFLQKSFKVGNGPRGCSWLQSSPLQLSAWQILTTNWTTHVHHPFSPCMDPQFQSRGHQGNLSWKKCQMMSDVFLI